MTVIISPHLDDAVLSLGSFMQTEPCDVVTVFAGVPAQDVLSDYDRDRGWSSSSLAMHNRRAEDITALRLLDARRLAHLPLLDAQYRPEIDTVEAVREAIYPYFSPDEYLTFVPMGLGHPDHGAVFMAALDACWSMVVYEELPYKVMWPELVRDRLNVLQEHGFEVQVHPLPQGDWERKAEAIAAYHSQFPEGALDPRLAVPERAWRAWRPEMP